LARGVKQIAAGIGEKSPANIRDFTSRKKVDETMVLSM
jgi:hypothetical protein